MTATQEVRQRAGDDLLLKVTGIYDFACALPAEIDLRDSGLEDLLGYIDRLEAPFSTHLDPTLGTLLDALNRASAEAREILLDERDDENEDDDECEPLWAVPRYVASETLAYALHLYGVTGLAIRVSTLVRTYRRTPGLEKSFSYSNGFTAFTWVYGNTYDEAFAAAMKWAESRIAGWKKGDDE